MPNPIAKYESFIDILTLLDRFKNQFVYLSFGDTLPLNDSFDHQYQDFILKDQLFPHDEFHVIPLNLPISDNLSFRESWKNVSNLIFTDVLFLVDVWNPLIIYDTLPLTDSFLFSSVWNMQQTILFTDSFHLTGSFGNSINDNLNLQSIFVYMVMPTGTIC